MFELRKETIDFINSCIEGYSSEEFDKLTKELGYSSDNETTLEEAILYSPAQFLMHEDLVNLPEILKDTTIQLNDDLGEYFIDEDAALSIQKGDKVIKLRNLQRNVDQGVPVDEILSALWNGSHFLQ